MPHAGAVRFVDALADLGADHRADRGAEDDRDRTILLVGARADRAADCAADHGTDFGGVAPPPDYAVILLPSLAGVADIVRVVLLAPPVRLGVRRRLRRRRQWNERNGDERQQREMRCFHYFPLIVVAGAVNLAAVAARRR